MKPVHLLSRNKHFVMAALSIVMAHVSYSKLTVPAIATYFGTKCRYEDVNLHLRDDILFVNKSLMGPPSAACKAVHLVAVLRHGTRYPTAKNIRKLASLYDLVMAEASGPAWWLEGIKSNWTMWYTEDMDGKLVTKGKEDHRHLAIRLAKTFPTLMSRDNLLGERIEFLTSSKHRCVDSVKAFQEGLHQHLDVRDLVEAAFFLCSYELAIKSENSLWCNTLDEVDAEVLEYKNDLKQYWKRGYGYDINRKSSCSLFHDLFRRLEEASHYYRLGKATKAATVQVGHAETLLPLLSLMGFFRDKTPLTAENFSVQRGRKFRTSQLVPYAANLLFVLYECRDELRLQFFLNEKPVQFPSMGHPAPLYDTVRAHYSKLLQGCDFNKECELPKVNHMNTEL
ncbi:multiple inositol polyphosphate phosphatase 1b isoform X3 [Electrophorus electricus]|uniref:multiple inositol polyphosphate phosphatase 1b isoform X3 n=1 Tax=Electrophorus electricus TaxID=8005 RepID=UPI0015CFA068|nr:multiple inositol polyphosphate phosphatase 1b isoform X3 [Electrophorus electricus]